MKHKEMPAMQDIVNENSDFPGYRVVEDEQEAVSYHEDSNVRIWYNDMSTNFEKHWHNALEMIYVKEGWYDIVSEGNTYHLEENEIGIIPSGVAHELKAPPKGVRFIYLINIEPFRHMKDYALLHPLFTQCIAVTPKNEPLIYDAVRLQLEKAVEIYFSKENFREMSIYSHVSELFMVLGRDRISRVSRQGAFKWYNYNDRFDDVLNYINDHFTEDLTLDDVAEHCGFSKFYFSKLFKEYSNMTFLNYLTYKRVSAAEEMLVSTNLTITDIAISSGFSSISSFNRNFKLLKGCSPSKYKDLYLSNAISVRI